MIPCFFLGPDCGGGEGMQQKELQILLCKCITTGFVHHHVTLDPFRVWGCVSIY